MTPTYYGSAAAQTMPKESASTWAVAKGFMLAVVGTVALGSVVATVGAPPVENQLFVTSQVSAAPSMGVVPAPFVRGPIIGQNTPATATGVAGRLQRLKGLQEDLLAMLMGEKMKVIDPEKALPGRQEAMPIINEHYVLKTPIEPPFPEGLESIVFGTGCFWGTEKMFWKLPGVYSTAVGYAAGTTPNPTYEEVCSGYTGHNEVVQVVYDPKKISFADLLRNFWESHDPTAGMGQGNDRGTQYRSGIYYKTPEQKALAEASMATYSKLLSAKGYGPITTELVSDPKFYYAENYHQQYLAKPGSRPYCSAQPSGVSLPPFSEWAPAGMEGAASKLPEEYWAEYGPKPGCTIGGTNAQNPAP